MLDYVLYALAIWSIFGAGLVLGSKHGYQRGEIIGSRKGFKRGIDVSRKVTK